MANSGPKTPAVVLGLGVTGLAALRGLWAKRVPVTGLDYTTLPAGRFSLCARTASCPHPEKEPEDLCETLLRLAPRNSKAVLIPTGDLFLLFVSRHRSTLGSRFLFSLPSQELVETLVDKRRQYALAKHHNFSCPKTLSVPSADALRRQAYDIDYPAILKPAYSHHWWPVFRNKAMAVRNQSELEQKLETVSRNGLSVVAQSVIPGPVTDHYEVCVLIDRNGVPGAVFTTRKLRQWPSDFGTGTLLASCRHADLEARSVRFLQDIGFRGTAAIEYKKHAETGEFVLIEVNARLWSDHALAQACGLNFPHLAYLDAIGERSEPSKPYPTGVRWLDGGNDLWVSAELIRQCRLDLSTWRRSLAGTRSFAFFSASDPLPCVWEIMRYPLRGLLFLLRMVRAAKSIPSSLDRQRRADSHSTL